MDLLLDGAATRLTEGYVAGVLDQFWLWSMQSGLKNAYDSIKAFSETDFTRLGPTSPVTAAHPS